MKVNGESVPCAVGMTILQLLQERALNPQRVAVEKNGQIVARAHFADEPLCDTDTVELVQFVGGG